MLSRAGRLKAEFGPTYLVNLKRRDPQTEAHFAAYFSCLPGNQVMGKAEKSRSRR